MVAQSFRQRFEFELAIPGFSPADFDAATSTGRARETAVRQALSMALGIDGADPAAALFVVEERRRRLCDGCASEPLEVVVHVDVQVGEAEAAAVAEALGSPHLPGQIRAFLATSGLTVSRALELSAAAVQTETMHSISWALPGDSERAHIAATMDKLQSRTQMLAAVNGIAGSAIASSLDLTVVERTNQPAGEQAAPPPPSTVAASCGDGTVWDRAAALCLPGGGGGLAGTAGAAGDGSAAACGPGTRWDGRHCVAAAGPGGGRCKTAEPGSSCYADVSFVLGTGLRSYPRWYPSCMASGGSSRAEAQAYLHSTGSSCDATPCGYDAAAEACWTSTCKTVQPMEAGPCAEAIGRLIADPAGRPANWPTCLSNGLGNAAPVQVIYDQEPSLHYRVCVSG